MLAIGSVLFAFLLSLVGAPMPSSARALTTSQCSTAQLSDVMAVYLSTPAPRTAASPIPRQANSYLAHILRARLAACRATLGWTSSAAPQSGKAAAACFVPMSDGDAHELWALLNFCVELANGPALAPAGIPWQVPASSGTGDQHIIFVVGLGGDPAMQGKLISTLTTYLNQAGRARWYHFMNSATFIAEPTWQPDTYATVCASSPNVDGTMVLQITAAGSGSSDRFFTRRNWSAVDATALYAQCSATPRRSPAYVWASDIAPQEGHSNTLTLLTPLALLLTLGSTYEIFEPVKSTTVAQTRIFRNPLSPTPPPGGRLTQTVTSDQTTLNASSLANLSTAFLASSINYTNAVTSPSQLPTVDELTWNTLQSLAIKLMTEMNCWAPGAPPQGAPQLSDVVGSSRTLPAYSAPPGLGSYTTGKPSAPFCKEPSQPDVESIRDIQP